MIKITASCPGKLMLFGDHAVVHKRHCLVTAVDQRLSVTIEFRNDKKIVLVLPGLGSDSLEIDLTDLADFKFPRAAIFIGQTLKNFGVKHDLSTGLTITTRSEFKSTFGFGSSSAVTVATWAALFKIFNIEFNNRDLFSVSYQTVLDIQGVGSGFDLAAAIWGGTIFFATGGKTIEPLAAKNLPIIVGFTGVKADTATLVKQVGQLKDDYPKLVKKLFDDIESIVLAAKQCYAVGDWQKIGQYMNFQQGLLESLGVGSWELSKLIYSARNAGALGAKLSGAGGGDCMIAVATKDSKTAIERAIIESGGQVLPVKLGATGLRLEVK